VLRAGGRLDSEMFPESMAADRSFHDPDVYAGFLCARRVDRILHDDTHDEKRHTDEIEMIDTLEREAHAGVALHRIASGPGWQADAVDRSGCTTS
jgi:hypothetical protein